MSHAAARRRRRHFEGAAAADFFGSARRRRPKMTGAPPPTLWSRRRALLIKMCDKCKVDLHEACFKLLHDHWLTMLVFMEIVIFRKFCCSLFQLRHRSTEYGLKLYLYSTVIATRTYELGYFAWNNHFRTWWHWNALCDCPGPLVPSVPFMEHRNKIKNHMEFLKINEKLGWHSYSNMKQCKINEN